MKYSPAKRLLVAANRARRRAEGRCLECAQPAVPERGGRCASHADRQRARSRAWMRKRFGHAPRYDNPDVGYADPHFTFLDGWQQPYFEADRWGQARRVLVYWDDPLTVLLKLEAAGYNVFHAPTGALA